MSNHYFQNMNNTISYLMCFLSSSALNLDDKRVKPDISASRTAENTVLEWGLIEVGSVL